MRWARLSSGAAFVIMYLIVPPQAPGGPLPQAQHAEHVPDADHAVHRHHGGIFLGATTNLSADHTDPTVGIDYEYRLPVWHNRIGVAAFGEFTFAAHDEWIIGSGVVFRPAEALKLFAGGGLLFVEDSEGGEVHSIAATTSEENDDSHSLWRVGAGWEIHAGSLSVTPTLFYDRVEGHGNLVYGVAIGIALGRGRSGAPPH